MKKLLVANRGEIAVRIMRTAAEMGIETVAVYSEDDDRCLHVKRADSAVALHGHGPAPYLDVDGLVQVARQQHCDAVHPGYGFLSENPLFAVECDKAGIRFVGPTAETLEQLGDKVTALNLARVCKVPILPGTSGATDLAAAREFFDSLGSDAAVMVKAIAGGGGRGIRPVTSRDDLERALERCRSEAQKAFGNGDLYVEKLLRQPRHIEVQIAGDGSGRVIDLGERDCSVQRRHQKIVEIAPAPGLDAAMRGRLSKVAIRMAERLSYRGLGTFEFLVETGPAQGFYFIEANARLQVEHTVTEEVLGIDLVQLQLDIADGRSFDELEIPTKPRGFAIQLRINAEQIDEAGVVRPQSGTLNLFDIPSGRGIRTDTAGYAGYTPSSSFDSLLAKVIVHSGSGSFDAATAKSMRALREFRIDGVATNRQVLATVLQDPEFRAGRFHTEMLGEILADSSNVDDSGASLFFDADTPAAHLAGARVDPNDPLAVLEHGKTAARDGRSTDHNGHGHGGGDTILAPVQGTVVSVEVEVGSQVESGQELLVLEAMKMEQVVEADRAGVVTAVHVAAGDTVFEGHRLLEIEPTESQSRRIDTSAHIDLDKIRPDLAETRERHDIGLDAARPDSVERRRKTGHRTARENINDLCDPDSFVEYGALVLAAQRRRRSTEELIERTPADGMVVGIGRINGDRFDEETSQCAVLSYDYTVLAGTQGLQNHRKKDRLFELAAARSLPVVLFAEGGGGRPGDTDGYGVTGLDCLAFKLFGELSGLVPLVGITTGRCFAGNAALLGCCDVVIATAGSNIGMGGPAMVEGGGLGVFRPEEIGPMEVQVANGVVDIPVADEAEAVDVAKRYLSYFQGETREWECADQRTLRHVIPENRLRIYDVREVIDNLADSGSVLELRRAFGPGMVTALARIEGRPVGIIANNPVHLAGAIDSNGADKASRFMQLCDANDLPIVFLCDTPGIMVGPEAEKTALVRHAARMFVTSASLTVPFCTIVLRKGYGLGAQAMAGGSFKAPHFTIAWPTGEFGGMGLEGAVKLGFRRELAAIEDRDERNKLYTEMVDRMYQVGKAVNIASHFEIDEVIDPAESRKWILSAVPITPRSKRRTKKRRFVDTW